MKKTIKLTLLAAICTLWVPQISFSDEPLPVPTRIEKCSVEKILSPWYSQMLPPSPVECTLCDLVKVRREYDDNGIFKGITYIYEEGSEPETRWSNECTFVLEKSSTCAKVIYFPESSGCSNIFLDCDHLIDPECDNLG